MIYMGVGTDPLKWSGEGDWEEDGARLPRGEETALGLTTRWFL